MNKTHFLITIFISLYFCIHSQEKGLESIHKDGYTIEYPNNWEINESGMMGTSLLLFSNTSTESDTFRENVNIIVQDLSEYDLDLDSFTKLSEAQLKTMITDLKILKNIKLNNNKTEYQDIIYTGKQGKFDLKVKQRYCVINKKSFILTFTSEVNDYDQYISTVEKIFDSFEID